MSIDLDLDPSRAKLRRASLHVEALDEELGRVARESQPFTVEFGSVDRDTGWVAVDIVAQELGENDIGVILGDVMHNLRSALDYIVTACVEQAGATLQRKHQFPILMNRTEFKSATRNGCLAGVTQGLDIFERVQPYKATPEPRASSLWHIQAFSNSDKHRSAAIGDYRIEQCTFSVLGSSGEKPTDGEPRSENLRPSSNPGDRTEVYRCRFAGPFPDRVRVDNITVRAASVLVAPAFGQQRAVGLPFQELMLIRDDVGHIVDDFAAL